MDRNGWSILTSLGYSTSFAMFLVEAAQKLDATSNVALPLSCQPAEQTLLHVDGVTRDNGQVHVALTLSLPTIRSDCDAGTVGAALGGCPDGPLSIPPRGLGRLYTRVTECNAGVGDIRTSAWALAGAPDSEGHAAISFPEPTSLSECAFIGATYRLGGTETPAIGGFVKIKHGNDCPDADGDGLTACGGDCNDADPNTRPGRPEICDGMDNDCDGAADELLGMESCGLGACARTVPRCTNGAPQNCVPGSPSPEGLTCDGVDNDCNGLVDDVPHPADADGDGNPCNIDCNDHDRFSRSRSIEICNGLDDDCDGLVDDLDDTVADLDDDLRAGVCDDCPTSYDPAQGDLDSDGRGDACDNCPSADNSQQDDLDHDAEGDACDLDDGLILIRASQAFVYWQAESGFDSFNLYRGDLAVLRQTGESTQDPATVPLAARACDLPDPDVLDATALSPGQAVFWLVTGNGPGGESSLGTDSTGQPRPNTHPCP
ncbi:MAG TPA: putative metal-binding motif-containing protein [Candidatus Polarisedimenticolia bacterium]|nr:putative metal-binding motif-containing protein [Candidatus Polarisedimenticolia bacterium]